MTSLRILLVFGLMFLAPGWCFLALTGVWRRWEGLQRWIVAIGLSIAFYPVLFYLLRPLAFLTLGPYKMGTLLLVMGAYAIWRLRAEWRQLMVFDTWEWAVLAVFALTIFTRFWVIRDYPFPAWSDSLHHTLLTQLTAVQGRLPTDMQPYSPVPLSMYHLGLYAVSATLQWLGQIPAHTALLWAAQGLNGLCGVGVYFFLERRIGRAGALVGALVAGLLSHQPSYYVNWGRFTQVAAQALLLCAARVTWDALDLARAAAERRASFGMALSAAFLSAAVFLYHFRVAAFYLPLVGFIVLGEVWSAFRRAQGMRVVGLVVLCGGLGLLFVSPALWDALRMYSTRAAAPVEAQFAADVNTYFEFPLEAITVLGLRPPLLWAGGIGALLVLARRRDMGLLILGWTTFLMGLGYAYLLPWRLLHVTNLGAVVIMLYLPAALLLGSGAQVLADLLAARSSRWGTGIVLGLALVGALWLGGARLCEIEPGRHFVTPADVTAMAWIRANTPPEAVFAVNTEIWTRSSPHGIDGGYWIPYFAGRKTTAGTMLASLGPRAYSLRIVELSELAVQLDATSQTAAALRDAGVEYVYVGARQFASNTAWNMAALTANPALDLMYDQDGVRVFRIHD